jgi:hypothetical protein
MYYCTVSFGVGIYIGTLEERLGGLEQELLGIGLAYFKKGLVSWEGYLHCHWRGLRELAGISY